MRSNFKRVFAPAANAIISLGFDPTKLAALRYYPRYRQNRKHWLSAGGKIDGSFRILSDYADSAGSAAGHYFHQDLLVASKIFDAKPKRHADVGSRIDGFVAHVASFRQIDIFDIRPVAIPAHENISFVQADLMNPLTAPVNVTDSLSCLHTLEHFGLGRYGDPINPTGHLDGFRNLIAMLTSGGTFYLSFPIAKSTSVQFNAHRIFNPTEVLTWPGSEDLELVSFDFVDDAGNLQRNWNLTKDGAPNLRYGCGIFTFRKLA